MEKIGIVFRVIYKVIEQIMVLKSLKKHGIYSSNIPFKKIVKLIYEKEVLRYEGRQQKK